MKALLVTFLLVGCLVVGLVPACSSGGPQVGSQTNWLRGCEASPDACGDLVCVCGTCTLSCDDKGDCAGVGTESCVVVSELGATAACDGQIPTAGMCLPRCDDESCPDGTICVAGVCVASREASASIEIDASTSYQSLIGFGASLGLDEDFIVGHPQKEEIFDAMFVESGFDFVRVRNRFRGDNADDLEPAREILDAAEQRLGRRPTIFLTSGSPPPSLKANGVAFCSNADPECTLIRNEDGEFDYAGFAEHWRASLEAYAAVGIFPDYVGIQNNPNWIPLDEASVEACRFLPQEGTATVDRPDGTSVEAEFPGYEQALDSVVSALETLPNEYLISGPETSSVAAFEGYVDVLGQVDSLAYHLYESDPRDISTEGLSLIRSTGEERNQPIIQSEMSAAGIEAALLVHQALTTGGSSAYLQLGFVVGTDDESFGTLIGADDTTFKKHPTYFALSHYARFTDLGWIRVQAESDSEGVSASAWLSPEEDALTIVLVNGEAEPADVELANVEQFQDLFEVTKVVRTVFGGAERMVDLGELSPEAVVRLPAESVVTIAASKD